MPLLTKKFLTFLTNDPEPMEVCRFLNNLELVTPNPRASVIAIVKDDGSIGELARFGLVDKDIFSSELTVWHDLEPLRRLRKNQLVMIHPDQVRMDADKIGLPIKTDTWIESILFVPISKREVPLGALVMMFDHYFDEVPELEMDYESLQAIFSIILRTPTFTRAQKQLSAAAIPQITDLERNYLEWIARGFSNKQIAAKTQQALPTVKARVSRLLKDFDVNNRRELAEKYRQLSG